MNREADLVEVIDGLVRSRGALESAANVRESMSNDGKEIKRRKRARDRSLSLSSRLAQSY